MPINFQLLVLLTFEWSCHFSQYDDTDEVCFRFRFDSAIQVQSSTNIPMFCLFIKMPRQFDSEHLIILQYLWIRLNASRESFSFLIKELIDVLLLSIVCSKNIKLFYEIIANLKRTRRCAVRRTTRNFTTQKIKEGRGNKWERECGFSYETGKKKGKQRSKIVISLQLY